MRRKIAVALTSVLASFGFTFAVTPSAEAATLRGGVSVSQACYYTYGWDNTIHGNNVHSWRCVAYGSNGMYVFGGVDLNRQCVRQYGSGAYASYTNYNDPYSWKCYR
jgi:hypothetical protein